MAIIEGGPVFTGYAEMLHTPSGRVLIEKASRRACACSRGLEV